MATDQHFCLRWNNHQSTLISVFDTLLESGTLVDCTLAADGQQLKAHKVVLSACSPYLEALLSQHYDKHPIIILRDVKFPELKAMLDYMYRGEVNITQEQLGTFLKAAESLQIKGLTDSGGGGGGGESKRHDLRKQLSMPAAITPQSRPRSGLGGVVEATPTARKSAGSHHIPPHIMDVPPSSPLKAREGSVSPVVKKRRKPDHPMHNDDARGLLQSSASADNSRSPTDATPDEHMSAAAPTNNNTTTIATTTTTTTNNNNLWPNSKTVAPPPVADAATNNKDKSVAAAEAALLRVKCEQADADMLQPKSEYIDDDMNDNENSVDHDGPLDEDDDDDDGGVVGGGGGGKTDASKPGPSQTTNTQGYQSWMEDDSSNEESGASNNQQNSQGYGQWHVSTDGSADETMMTAPPQDSQGYLAVAAAQVLRRPLVPSLKSMNEYMAALNTTISIPPVQMTASPSIACPTCNKLYSSQHTLRRHVRLECNKEPQFQCPYCPRKTKQRYNLMLHIARAHKANVVMPTTTSTKQ